MLRQAACGVPLPALVEPSGGAGFSVTGETAITLLTADADAARVARDLAMFIMRSTGAAPKILGRGEAAPASSIALALSGVGSGANVGSGSSTSTGRRKYRGRP